MMIMMMMTLMMMMTVMTWNMLSIVGMISMSKSEEGGVEDMDEAWTHLKLFLSTFVINMWEQNKFMQSTQGPEIIEGQYS